MLRRLPRNFQAELYLLHVVQDLALFMPDALSGTPPYMPPADQMLAAVRESLDRLAREQLASLKVHCLVREGAPFYEIITCAKENSVDLIVLGTHGRGLLGAHADGQRRREGGAQGSVPGVDRARSGA